MGIPLGRNALGMSIWDLVKLTDYITTRDDCDVKRIGCAGLSGGGMQSLYLAAIDERILCTCTSGYFYGVLESHLVMNENCDCNYVPDLWKHFDMGDIAAMIAPRALIIETGDKDSLNGESGLDNIVPQLQIARKAYEISGFENNIAHSVFDGEHAWCGRDVYPFFRKFI
jgi:dienelactone hydrolase